MSHPAIWWKNQTFSYQWLDERIEHFFSSLEIPIGSVVAIQGTFHPSCVPLLFALLKKNCIVVPLVGSSGLKQKQDIASVEFIIEVENENIKLVNTHRKAEHFLYSQLRESNSPGLVLFTTGSTGVPKAALHNATRLMNRYAKTKSPFRLLAFLAFDHMGGIHTILSGICSGGTLVFPEDRSPTSVCHAVQDAKVEILPVTPTFLRVLLFSEAHQIFNLSSLRRITYGAEPMPSSLLNRLQQQFPNIEFKQTYGLTECGVFKTTSENSASIWIKLSVEFPYRIRNNKLEIKSPTQMLGYLNARNDLDPEWHATGDLVEEKNGWLRILGRESEIINVAGWKIHPSEVESVILEMPGVQNVTVSAEENPILGQIVRAEISPPQKEGLTEFVGRLRNYCADRLPHYAVPQKVVFSELYQDPSQIKKIRN